MGVTSNINDGSAPYWHPNESLPVSQYAQYQDPETDTAVWNTAVIKVMNYTSTLPVLTRYRFNPNILTLYLQTQ